MCDYEWVFEPQLSDSVRLSFDNEQFYKSK